MKCKINSNSNQNCSSHYQSRSSIHSINSLKNSYIPQNPIKTMQNHTVQNFQHFSLQMSSGKTLKHRRNERAADTQRARKEGIWKKNQPCKFHFFTQLVVIACMLLKSNQNKIGKVAALNWFTLEWRWYFQFDPDFVSKKMREK